MSKLMLIAVGGGIGSLLRYLLSSLIQRTSESSFPLGTMTVNILGCAAIGALTAAWSADHAPREAWRVAVLVGVLGGFTTFSAFGFETFQLANQGHLARAGLNILLTNAACLGAVWLGFRFVERFAGT